jgi:hypothetical protein
MLAGLILGVGAAAVGAGYLWLIVRFDLFADARAAAEKLGALANHPVWYAILGVGMAPFFEEYLFRGMVYRGMARSFTPWIAIAGSAALFAVVHPAISVAPVFVLGLLTACGYRWSGRLITPIVTHMVYNGLVIGKELM